MYSGGFIFCLLFLATLMLNTLNYYLTLLACLGAIGTSYAPIT